MTKLALIPALLLACLLGACGPAFTSSELTTGLGEAGEAPQGIAGSPPEAAGSAGAPGTAGAGGSPTSAGGFGGGVVQVAGDTGTSAGGFGGALSQDPPCANAVDVSMPDYLDVPKEGVTCFRFPVAEAFDTVTCGGVLIAHSSSSTPVGVAVNGQPITCGQKQTYAPAVDGYNYLEIHHPAGVTGGWVRWFVLETTVPCAEPIDPLKWPMWISGTGSVCIRTRQSFTTVTWTTGDTPPAPIAEGRTLTIDGFQEPSGEPAVGYPPTTDPDGYIYVVVSPGGPAYLSLR